MTVVSEHLLRDRMRALLVAAYTGLPVPAESVPLVRHAIRNRWLTPNRTITTADLALLDRITEGAMT